MPSEIVARSSAGGYTNKRRWLCAGVLVLLNAQGASAQGTLRSIRSDFEAAFGDVWAVWIAPTNATRRDWAGAGAAAGAFLLAMPFDDDVDHFIVHHTSAASTRAMVAVSDTGSVSLIKWGSAHRLYQLSGGLYLLGLGSGKAALRDAGIGCATSVASNNIPRHLLYYSVSRLRPRGANGDQYQFDLPGGPFEEHSFFGGHVANAMACASFFSKRFDLSVAEPVLYVLALGVGAGRMADQRHWTSDTILGAVFGYAVGRSVALRSKERARSREAGRASGDAGWRFDAWQEGESLRMGWRRTF